ncbi:MAG: hypothetical protein K2Q30_11345 [Gemmataceae bacterium]|nr:hypothetical protein [Gemmataceae bacterium]
MPRPFPRSLWFFAILSVLGTTAIVVPWVFNRSIQLSTQQIDQAISLWKTAGATDYDLEILEAKEPGGFKKQLLIKVRNQKTTSLVIDGNFAPLQDPSQYQVLDLLESMAKNLATDQQSSQPFFTTASLASKDGHPLRYVRRNSITKERFEWVIKMKTPG